MGLKTFNLSEDSYKTFSEHCKKEGISMSKKIDNFIKSEMERMGKQVKVSKEIIKKKKTILQEHHSFSKYC